MNWNELQDFCTTVGAATLLALCAALAFVFFWPLLLYTWHFWLG